MEMTRPVGAQTTSWLLPRRKPTTILWILQFKTVEYVLAAFCFFLGAILWYIAGGFKIEAVWLVLGFMLQQYTRRNVRNTVRRMGITFAATSVIFVGLANSK